MENNVLVVGVPKGDALRYSDLTAEQIAELKKPATDAAAGVNKVNNEFKQLKASVETAEKGRADAEAGRKEKETERGQNETKRKELRRGARPPSRSASRIRPRPSPTRRRRSRTPRRQP